MTKTRNPGSVIAATAVVAFSLAACAAPAVTAEGGEGSESIESMEPITLSVADIDPVGGGYNVGLEAFAAAVEERSNGRITLEIYPVASLVPGEQVLAAVGSGAADAGRIIPAYFPQELPVTIWFNAMSGMEDYAEFPQGFLAASAVSQLMHTQPGAIRDELESHNVTPLISWKHAPYSDMVCTSPVNSLEDFRGLQVRVVGSNYIPSIEALGGVAVPMPLTETYEALQRGVVDCAMLEVPSHIGYGVWEVAKYYVPVRISMHHTAPFVINTDVWEALPQEAQDLLRVAAFEQWSGATAANIEQFRQFASEGVDERGIVFGDASELDPIVLEVQQARYDSLVEAAPAAVTDPEAYIDDFRAMTEEWFELTTEALPVDDVNVGRDPASLRTSYIAAAELDYSALWSVVRDRAFAAAP